jgi:hypothetical protein
MVRRLIAAGEFGDSGGNLIWRIIDMQIRSVGIDLGKSTFH